MQTEGRPLGQRLWTGFVRLVGTLFVIALLGLVAYLASERNARRYSFAQSAGELVVMKGKMLPMGVDPWQPDDPGLAETYAPVPLDGGKVDPALLERRFDDRDELDRALFGILETQVRPLLQTDEPAKLDRGVYYLRRAQRLSGLTAEQRQTLEGLQGQVAFYLARNKLDQARKLLAEALAELKVAATSQSGNATAANQVVAEIAEPTRQLEEAAARVLGGLKLAPPALPKPAEPQQPPAPTAPTAPTAPIEDSGAVKTDSQTEQRPEAEIPTPQPSDGN